jgi:NADPH:quinone reductase-like Zn-dependent oxidoreductase
VRAVIDRVCPLAQAPQAFAALGAGLAQGKIVIRVAD